jgi:NADH dehydrogenase (ubiquinone) 1 alpha/beta subcomplex 1
MFKIKSLPFKFVNFAFKPKNFYITEKEIQLREEKHGYYKDPNEVARRLIKLIALHDKVKNPHLIKLQSTWHEIGLDELSYVEVMLEAEQEFCLEFPDDEVERFKNVEDAVEFVARSFFAK